MNILLDQRGQRSINIDMPYTRDTYVFKQQLATIKRALGTRWDASGKTWYADGPEVVLDLEREEIAYALRSAAVDQIISDFRTSMDGALWARNQLHEGMFGYQAAGSEYLYWGKRAILADGMGLGKTKQSIDTIKRVWCEEGPTLTLVVVLKTLVYNWPAEFQKWADGIPVEVLPDAPKQRVEFWKRFGAGMDNGTFPVVVCNYEKLSLSDFPKNIRWRIVVADEATYIKNPGAGRSLAFFNVASGAEWIWLLTGTPIEIRYEELHTLFGYIRPAVLGSFTRFRDAHLISDYAGSIIGARNLNLLTERVAPWVLRRTKSDVQLQLPPKLYSDVLVELSASERDGYDVLLYEFDEWLAERGEEVSTANVLTQMLRLQQYTSSPALLDEEERGSKFQLVRDIVSEWEGRTLIFTRFSEMADRLLRWFDLPADAIIQGEIKSARERLRRIDAFNAGQLGDVLISTDAGAHGLNITGADLVIHYDMLWNPAKMRQREDRLHRIGQTNTVHVLRMLAARTLDEGMARVADTRQIAADTLLDAADEHITKQLRLNYRKLARGEDGVAKKELAGVAT